MPKTEDVTLDPPITVLAGAFWSNGDLANRLQVQYREYYDASDGVRIRGDGVELSNTDWHDYGKIVDYNEARRLCGRIREKCAEIGAKCETRIVAVSL